MKRFYTPHGGCVRLKDFLASNTPYTEKLKSKLCPRFVEEHKGRYVKVVFNSAVKAFRYWLTEEEIGLSDEEIISRYPKYEDFLYCLDVKEDRLISPIDESKYLIFIN